MGRPLLKAILERVMLFFVPIALGYIWRAVTEARAASRPDSRPDTADAPRRAEPMPARTWLWLAAAGAVLVAASLIGGVFLPHAPDRGTYIPAEVRPGGAVTPGHFVPAGNSDHD
jgi:hypothetical protein